MFVKSIVSALALTLGMAGVATAQQAAAPTRIQQFQAWGAYSYKSGASTVCYVLSVPTAKQPASVDHGDNFFIVSQRPGQNISYEPQAMMGYTVKENSKINVVIDNKTFVMFHQGQGRLGRERGAGAGPRRSDEDRSFDDGQCRLAQGHGHVLQLFAFGHLGCAEADRKLQVSGLPTGEFRRGRPCAGPCRFYL